MQRVQGLRFFGKKFRKCIFIERCVHVIHYAFNDFNAYMIPLVFCDGILIPVKCYGLFLCMHNTCHPVNPNLPSM
jgi:hypothetical protein